MPSSGVLTGERRRGGLAGTRAPSVPVGAKSSLALLQGVSAEECIPGNAPWEPPACLRPQQCGDPSRRLATDPTDSLKLVAWSAVIPGAGVVAEVQSHAHIQFQFL